MPRTSWMPGKAVRMSLLARLLFQSQPKLGRHEPSACLHRWHAACRWALHFLVVVDMLRSAVESEVTPARSARTAMPGLFEKRLATWELTCGRAKLDAVWCSAEGRCAAGLWYGRCDVTWCVGAPR